MKLLADSYQVGIFEAAQYLPPEDFSRLGYSLSETKPEPGYIMYSDKYPNAANIILHFDKAIKILHEDGYFEKLYGAKPFL